MILIFAKSFILFDKSLICFKKMMDCIIVETVNGRPVLWEREPNDPALDEEIERIQTIPSDKDLFCIYDVSINAGTLQSIMATS